MRKGKKQKIKLPASVLAPSITAGASPVLTPPLPTAKPKPVVPVATAGKPAIVSRERLWAALPGVMAVLVYVNTWRGEFVYDDKRQIVRNSLIQDLSNFWTALASDVWAFKAENLGGATSNYWRPSFVLWMIANFQFFGLHPAGWHVANTLLHAGVTVLAYFLLRRCCALSRLTAGAVALLFALHPAHSESVAWIAGAPDLLMSLGILGSLWFLHRLQERQTARNWLLTLLLYAVALGAKEAAILYPLVVFVWLWQPDKKRVWKPAALWAAPFAGLALIYFLARLSVIGTLTQTANDAPGTLEMLLSVPEIFCFYLRQMIFPYWLGPSYSLRPVTTATIGAANFLLPLVLSLLAGALLLWLARRTATARLGLAMFLFFLAPAFNIAAFPREQAVHDRYLYLPVLGFLLLVVPPALAWLERQVKVRAVIYAVVGGLCLLLGAQTARYNRAWLSGLALFQRAVQSDPSAALNYDLLGAEFTEQKRWDEALAAYDESLKRGRLSSSLVGRADALTATQRYDEAIRDLSEITSGRAANSSAYTIYQAYERLAIAYERQGKYEPAVQALVEARKKLLQYAGALSEKIAVILYQSGQKDNALAQLEAAKPYARRELLPESRLVFYRLGLLYQEAGKPNEARAALQEYLALTDDMQDPITQQTRPLAAAALQK